MANYGFEKGGFSYSGSGSSYAPVVFLVALFLVVWFFFGDALKGISKLAGAAGDLGGTIVSGTNTAIKSVPTVAKTVVNALQLVSVDKRWPAYAAFDNVPLRIAPHSNAAVNSYFNRNDLMGYYVANVDEDIPGLFQVWFALTIEQDSDQIFGYVRQKDANISPDA